MWQLAWPIILANAAVPLLGLADTAVIGNAGDVDDLGAIALGSLIFSFVYWTFGFLRMGTTGFVAQAAGRGDEPELRAALGRALLMGVTLGVGIVALQGVIGPLALELISASAAVEAVAAEYFRIRIWGAPATLATFALTGALIGLGQSRRLLVVQVFLNALNIALDVLFAGVFGWGAPGIALGTAIAEGSACVLALVLVLSLLRERRRDPEPLLPWARIRELSAFRQTLGESRDLMLRTLCLLGGFAYFTNRSAMFGSVVLAANHLLLELVSFSAFFLDGYAHVAETLVGRAVGTRDRRQFDLALARTSELSAVTALGLAAMIVLGGPLIVAALTDLTDVREAALRYAPLSALYVLLAWMAFQLDGVFIGALRAREMRNASALSLALFLVAAWPLSRAWGNAGLWWAFIGYVVLRALTLSFYVRDLRPRPDEGAPTTSSGARSA